MDLYRPPAERGLSEEQGQHRCCWNTRPVKLLCFGTRFAESPKALRIHYEKKHEDSLNWPKKCKPCGARFRNDADLIAHKSFCACKKGDNNPHRRKRLADEGRRAGKVLYKLRQLGYTARSGPEGPPR